MAKIKLIGVALLIFAVVGIIFLTSRQSQSGSSGSGPVAIVNGEELPRDEYDARMAQIMAQNQISGEAPDQVLGTQNYSEQVLTQMISERLLLQDARSKGITVDDEAINTQYEGLKASFETEEAFNEALITENITSDQLWKNISNQLILEQYVDRVMQDRETVVTEEEIVASYEESIAGMENGPTLEEVRDQVEQQVQQQKLSAIMQEVIANLRDQADIQILI